MCNEHTADTVLLDEETAGVWPIEMCDVDDDATGAYDAVDAARVALFLFSFDGTVVVDNETLLLALGNVVEAGVLQLLLLLLLLVPLV